MSLATKPNAASSTIANLPCGFPTSCGAVHPTRTAGACREEPVASPEVLRQQVDRMIAHPRSDEFVAGFVSQWLDMERLDLFQFDIELYRDFDESTRAACRREVYESVAYLLRGSTQGHLGKLLKSDYVFVNGLLATYYGIEGVTGDEFRKIKLPANSPGADYSAWPRFTPWEVTASSAARLNGAWVLRTCE